ncbi:uncharacterized protein [Lepidochelys kempii]|uniref:uncharacterized protein isoform X3 n=1 Tax=Lepidochelys kempii TaxID=8472 RepID=UPI003C704B4E
MSPGGSPPRPLWPGLLFRGPHERPLRPCFQLSVSAHADPGAGAFPFSTLCWWTAEESQTGCSERGDFPRVLPGFVGSSSRASPRDSVTWGHQVSGPMEAAPSSQAPCKGSKSQRLQGIEEEPLASPPLDYRQYLYSLLGPERAEYFLSPPALERCRSPGEQGLLEAVGGARAGRRRSHAQDAAGGPVESAAARDAPAGGAAPGCNQPAAGQGAAHRPQ